MCHWWVFSLTIVKAPGRKTSLEISRPGLVGPAKWFVGKDVRLGIGDLGAILIMYRRNTGCIQQEIWVFPKIKLPQNGWFIWKTLFKWMIWGYHHSRKHPDISVNIFGFQDHDFAWKNSSFWKNFGFFVSGCLYIISWLVNLPHPKIPPRRKKACFFFELVKTHWFLRCSGSSNHWTAKTPKHLVQH